LKAKPCTSISGVDGLAAPAPAPGAPPVAVAVAVLSVLRVVLLLRSLVNQPMTLDALHAGPWTTTFRSSRDILATGHAPNVLKINILVQQEQKISSSVNQSKLHACV
jgi:hypothetical protein